MGVQELTVGPTVMVGQTFSAFRSSRCLDGLQSSLCWNSSVVCPAGTLLDVVFASHPCVYQHAGKHRGGSGSRG